MADEQVVKQLVDRLSSEDAAAQEATAEQIKYGSFPGYSDCSERCSTAVLLLLWLCRDLAQTSVEYCTAFGQHGAIEPLVGLLEDTSKPVTMMAAQALGCMVSCEPCCTQIR